jgi:hypothetical protein
MIEQERLLARFWWSSRGHDFTVKSFPFSFIVQVMNKKVYNFCAYFFLHSAITSDVKDIL